MREIGRYYHLSRKVQPDTLNQIINEMNHLEDVKSVEYVEEKQDIKVETLDNEFKEVMTRAVNIFSREANGTEITFAGFEYN